MSQRLILASLAVFSAVALAADEVRVVQYKADSLSPKNIPPTFDNGYLVVYGYGFHTTHHFPGEGVGEGIYAPDGSLAYTIPQYSPNVAVDTDGSSAAALPAGDNKGGIALFDPAGLQIRFIDTGQYWPCYVSFAPDHSIWVTGGWTSNRGNEPKYILRHFSRGGEELGGFLPSASFKGSFRPVGPISGTSGLRVTNDRIGVFLNYGGWANEWMWVETDLNGKEIGRWKLQTYPTALAPSGAVYAQEQGNVLRLDHATGKWTPVSVPFYGKLLGADGEALVFLDRTESRRVVVNRQ
jgi:hypothetical protein